MPYRIAEAMAAHAADGRLHVSPGAPLATDTFIFRGIKLLRLRSPYRWT